MKICAICKGNYCTPIIVHTDMKTEGPTVAFPRQYYCYDDPNTLYLHARCEMHVNQSAGRPVLEGRWLKDGKGLQHSSFVCLPRYSHQTLENTYTRHEESLFNIHPSLAYSKKYGVT